MTSYVIVAVGHPHSVCVVRHKFSDLDLIANSNWGMTIVMVTFGVIM